MEGLQCIRDLKDRNSKQYTDAVLTGSNYGS